MRICARCQELKPMDDFYTNYYCKPCAIDYRREWTAKLKKDKDKYYQFCIKKNRNMKKQINKLIELAKEYRNIGMVLNLPMTHNYIRNNSNFQGLACFKNGDPISIYINDGGKTWQVSFDRVAIIGYANQVQLPFDVTVKYLEGVYNDAKDHLESHLKPHLEEFKIDVSASKLKEIEELEKQLETLKSSL